jgi:adenine-specific DNA methylase
VLPIEQGFPIERVNEIAEKEGWAKQYYRPIYTMHKWWARRLGSVFRSICLYSLIDDPSEITIERLGKNSELSDYDPSHNTIEQMLESVSLDNPESLWPLYTKDVQVPDKKVLDPFMGGGTTLGEASRFGAEVTGVDLNPVAWFISKKEMEASSTALADLEAEFEEIKSEIADEIKQYYKTACPNAPADNPHEADVMYYFWVKELDCVSCNESVSLFNDYRIGKGRYDNKGTYNVLCPKCESIFHVEDWRSECTCPECSHEYIPQNGNVSRGYTCNSCGQKYGIVDAIQEQGGFDTRLYALEYHCPTCEEAGRSKAEVKSYKTADKNDLKLFEKAKAEWRNSPELREYVPEEEIPLGIMTDSTQFD